MSARRTSGVPTLRALEPGRIPIRTIALSQALQLGDDLTVEVRVLEAEHDELNWPDGHGLPPRSLKHRA
jgi:hypothetical protein